MLMEKSALPKKVKLASLSQMVIKSNFTVIKCTQSIFDICGYCVYIVQESFLMSVLDTQCQLLYALSPEAKNNICPPCPQNCKMSHMVEGRQFC